MKGNKYLKLLVLAPIIIFALTSFIPVEKSIPQNETLPYTVITLNGLPAQHVTVSTNHGICFKAPCVATTEANLNFWEFLFNLVFYSSISVIIYLILHRSQLGKN